MITYAADSHELYGELYYRPAAKFSPGATFQVHEWDSGKPLGVIAQAEQTYRVVGNMNEFQLVIGETTFGGREDLVNKNGAIDYGSLIYLALQRAKTAREAISTMNALVEQYGYASEGETFSIADPNEVWLMDFIGKGPDRKGAAWVAMRIPDGFVAAHANQARIRKFPLNDPDNALYAKDIVAFAREKGYFSGKDEDFSFTDAFAPPSCSDLRGSEARVWSFFNRVAPAQKVSADWVKCKKDAPILPLWIKPDQKLSPKDLMKAMRDHFEDTDFDMRNDVGAGPFALPYRWRPLTWKLDGKTYFNERATATQQTGFSFVSQSRSFLPNPVGGLLWFSVDDTASTVYVPMYVGIEKAPKAYAVGTGSFTEFTWDSAFWVFNWVANQAYSRYSNMIVDIQKPQGELENAFLANQTKVEDEASKLYKKSPQTAEAFLTKYSEQSSDRVISTWRSLGQQLFMKYLDGNVRGDKGKVEHPPYPDSWYRRIVNETGDKFLDSSPAPSASAPALPAPSSSATSVPTSPKASCGLSRNNANPGSSAALGLLASMLLLARRSSRKA
jgi:dipeptidase